MIQSRIIQSRITAKAQTTIPRAVRDVLGIGVGDTIVYRIKDGVVTIAALSLDDDGLPDNPFALFTEWADEADCAAFDHL